MQFLATADTLKIEDILPLFPDFVVIDDFKDEICNALEGYSKHIEALKKGMDEATLNAENIKRDIGDLKNRFTTLDSVDTCCYCELPLFTRQFYIFPCQHTFHVDCLIVLVRDPRTLLEHPVLTCDTRLKRFKPPMYCVVLSTCKRI